jgi:hypothetical protein
MKRLTGVLRSDIALIALTFTLAAALAPADGNAKSTPPGSGDTQSEQQRAAGRSASMSKGRLEQTPVNLSARRDQ